MGFLWKFIVGGWKWMAIIGIVSFLGIFAKGVYDDYQFQIERQIALTASNAKLVTVNAANQATIDAIRDQARENEIIRSILEVSLRKSETKINSLERLLSRHDLEFLALNKPGLIETRINKSTNQMFRDLECVTGNCSE